MAYYTKHSAVGIDVPIRDLQKFIYEKLLSIWSITASQINAFPRVYKIGDDLRHFTAGKDYLLSDLLLEDKFAVQYFFLDQNREYSNGLWSSLVDVYFGVNLVAIRPATTHRADEEIKQDIFNLLQQGTGGVVSIPPVDLVGYKDRMDMQPYHFFRFTVNLKYRYDKTV